MRLGSDGICFGLPGWNRFFYISIFPSRWKKCLSTRSWLLTALSWKNAEKSTSQDKLNFLSVRLRNNPTYPYQTTSDCADVPHVWNVPKPDYADTYFVKCNIIRLSVTYSLYSQTFALTWYLSMHVILSATRENDILICSPNNDFYQPVHPRRVSPHSLISVFIFCMKKLCIPCYSKCAENTPI